MSLDRRGFFLGAAGGIAGGSLLSWTLPAGAEPTPASGTAEDYQEFLKHCEQLIEVPPVAPPAKFAPTEDNILGPFHRPGAPFRGKITPPLEPGQPLVIRGRVWGHDTGRPLPTALLDVWQANTEGRYDNDDPKNPPKRGVFHNRARLRVDETGYYEYETIHPGRYSIGPDRWRPSHIHYLVQAPGYARLITQLYFHGDPMNEKDDFIKPSLIVKTELVDTGRGKVELGTFDIVLAKT